jgi:hypothetical protein
MQDTVRTASGRRIDAKRIVILTFEGAEWRLQDIQNG